MRCRASREKGWPKRRTVPESGRVMPIIMRMELDLPLPLGPRRPNMVPGDGEGETFYSDLGVINFADVVEFYDGHEGYGEDNSGARY